MIVPFLMDIVYMYLLREFRQFPISKYKKINKLSYSIENSKNLRCK